VRMSGDVVDELDAVLAALELTVTHSLPPVP
jgi:hypothetical protein